MRLESFPTIWQPAVILSNDTNAQAKWDQIKGNVPTNISVKSVPGNSTNNTSTYDPSDPDCWWTYRGCTTPKLPGLPLDVATVPEPGTLGYGFDDGPNCSHNAFYDYLQEQNQKATMFFIGSNVLDWPLEAQRAFVDGHEICVHTWSHKYMTSLPSETVFAELYYIAAGLDLRTVMWKEDSDDWRANIGNITAADVDKKYQALIDAANNGGHSSSGTIMLTHELNNFTMSEARRYYPKLKSVFKYIVPVGVAMNWTQLYVEDNYLQPSFQQYISGTTSIPPSNVSATSHGSGTGMGTGVGSGGGFESVAGQGGSSSVSSLSGPTNSTDDVRNGTTGSATGPHSGGGKRFETGWDGIVLVLTVALSWMA
ncbi:hypothetical protein AX16_002535 [Volvariella volvacea WC 439]|nr:hypothetical protein AX16_002535 [Volvariella volvacea WC 439]